MDSRRFLACPFTALTHPAREAPIGASHFCLQSITLWQPDMHMILIIPPLSTYYGLIIHIVMNGNYTRSCQTTPFIDKNDDWSCRTDVRLRYVKAKGCKTIVVQQWNASIWFCPINPSISCTGWELFLFWKCLSDSHCTSHENRVSRRNPAPLLITQRTF